MNTFRIAPWYLKLALLLLPFVLALRVMALSAGIVALFNPALRAQVVVSGLALDLASVVLFGLAAWAIWRPRPASRWVLAAAFVAMVGYSLLGVISPSAPLVHLGRIPAEESSPGYQLGEVLAPVAALGWAYLCVFGRRALDFFKVSHQG